MYIIQVLWVLLFFLIETQSTIATSSTAGMRTQRAVEEDHGHSEDECVIDWMGLAKAFNEVSVEVNLTTSNGTLCALHIPECDRDDDNDDDHNLDEEDHHYNEDVDQYSNEGSGRYELNSGSCQTEFNVCMDLIVHSGLSPSSCFSGQCLKQDSNSSSSSRPTSAEAYGLGFLMVTLVCLCSLLGVCIVPLIRSKDKNVKLALLCKYVYFFMIALGTSALLCDAILHLLPHAWGLHDHEEEENSDGHTHGEEEGHGHEGHGVEEFIWKGVLIILAVYLFYLLEYILHGITNHTHTHGVPQRDEEVREVEALQLNPMVSRGECAGTAENTTENDDILHPFSEAQMKESLIKKETKSEKQRKKHVLGWFQSIKPLAWLIIIGDGFHNFADGLALGAAVSQSLTLGISTTIALVFHEIPHEFGDYMILLSSGLTWYSALILNFISALTAILGFFVGVSAGTSSEEANAWILAIAAGLFIYIALVDLLPELIHSKEKGYHCLGLFFAANIGFFASFVALFLIAVYEESLNEIL